MPVNSPFSGPQQHDFSNIPPIPPMHRAHPTAQPGSLFARMQQERQYGLASQPSNNDVLPPPPQPRQSPEFAPNPVQPSHQGQQSPQFARKPIPIVSPPILPPPRTPVSREISSSPGMHPGMGLPMQPSIGAPWEQNRNIVPAVATGAAAAGLAAVTSTGGPPRHAVDNVGPYENPDTYGSPPPSQYGPSLDTISPRHDLHSYSSNSSQEPLTDAAATPGTGAFPGGYFSDYAPLRNRQSDVPGHNHSMSPENLDGMVFVDPHDVADDGDDGLFLPPQDPKRASRLSFGRHSKGSHTAVNSIPLGATGQAGTTGAAGAGGPFNRDASGSYGPVPGGNGPNSVSNEAVEKSAWMQDNDQSRRKWLRWLFIVLGIVVVLGIAGGAVGGILKSHKNSSSSGSSANSATADENDNGDLGINSSEIKALMNNPNLHKVFPGLDYTPLNSQYPACLTVPPDQNNVTRDMAVMSQLTNAVRLYGTDCNQTQMVLHSIDRLQFTPDQMQVWLGVWLDNNQTTGTRQMNAMYEILNQYGTKFIKGIIIGNEVLFREDMTAQALEQILTETKSNFTKLNIDLPVATSDLGSSWTVDLVEAVDIVMANVHPFFGGVPADQAAGWTWDFWQENDVVLTKGMSNKQNIIAETGWPSQGGNDCGSTAACTSSTEGAIAGIDELNTFMNGWVCDALTNGTEYFWFEAFDEPWKIIYDTPGEDWEDHWGLLDVNRNLKSGVTIPDCGGKTVS